MESETMEKLKKNFALDRYPNLLGMKLVELEKGSATVEMEVREQHLNFLGTTHGGAIFSLADSALGLASNSHGQTSVALSVHINFTRPTKAGDTLRATAKEERCTKRTGIYSVKVYDSRNNLVALATGTCYILSESSSK